MKTPVNFFDGFFKNFLKSFKLKNKNLENVSEN